MHACIKNKRLHVIAVVGRYPDDVPFQVRRKSVPCVLYHTCGERGSFLSIVHPQECKFSAPYQYVRFISCFQCSPLPLKIWGT